MVEITMVEIAMVEIAMVDTMVGAIEWLRLQ